MHSSPQLREIFHFCFLEALLKVSEPALYALKGGVNLRFYFSSPRYSEDMDLDVYGGSVATLKKNGYKVLNDPGLGRTLASYGIEKLLVNDPMKAKHTETTQRFRLRLQTSAGDVLPTKVEFSRRSQSLDDVVSELIPPELARNYNRLSYRAPHYSGRAAAQQKVSALARRTSPQARDLFDLYLLYAGGHTNADLLASLPASVRDTACETALSLSYDDYTGQVVEFLEHGARTQFASIDAWNALQGTVTTLLGHD